MQAAVNTYGVQAYARIQNISQAMSADRRSGLPASPSPSPFPTDDSVTISQESRQASQDNEAVEDRNGETPAAETQEKTSGQQALTKDELATLTKLKARDTEVRVHEQAHLAAAGQYATSSASFSYSTGPDGKRYATGGEVSIDMSKENSPQATAQKMRTVQRAALAPANPSATDRSVASQAAASEAQALQEIREESSVASTQSTQGRSATTEADTTSETEEGNSSPRAQASPPEQTALPPSDFSRKTMNSAYQAMLALAS